MGKADHSYESQDIRPKTRETVHKAILDWFKDQKRGSVLDAPAGLGHLSLKLKEMGYEVKCGEIEPEIFAAPGLKCIYTDLNRKIDVPDCSFDYICCVDGLEHMTNPYRAVEELARVLKPGGYGIFSIPNYSNIEKRYKFLWHGYLTKPVSTEKYEREGANLFNLHNSPLTITLLEFMLRIRGLEIIEYKKDAQKKKQKLLYPLIFLMRLVSFFNPKKYKEKQRTDLTLHPNIILGGNNLIVITRKKT